jgi:hypothetical protein
MGISIDMAKELVRDIVFTADRYVEDDGSVTLSLQNFDIVVNDIDNQSAMDSLVKELKEYALEFYKDIEFWGSDKNRREQLKKILKVLLADDKELRESIKCQQIDKRSLRQLGRQDPAQQDHCDGQSHF